MNWRLLTRGRPFSAGAPRHPKRERYISSSFNSPPSPLLRPPSQPPPPPPGGTDRPLGQGNSSSFSSSPLQLLTTPALSGGDAAWRPPPPIAFRDGVIVNSITNTPVDLHGFNWAGFNYIQYGMEFFEGLQEGTSTGTGDFATVVYRQQLLGFNLVRIPFRFASLFEEGEGKEREADYNDEEERGEEKSGSSAGGELLLARRRWRRPSRTLARRCRWTSRAALKKVVSNPTPPFYSQIDYDMITLPKPVAPPAKPASYATRKDLSNNGKKTDAKNGKGGNFRNPPACNWYLPDTTILDRMLFAVQYYVANGKRFFVLEREKKMGREKAEQQEKHRKSKRKKTHFFSISLPPSKPLSLSSLPLKKQNQTTKQASTSSSTGTRSTSPSRQPSRTPS